MLQLTPQHHIHIAVSPIDFRKGINGLMSLCEQSLHTDPFSGHIFVFRNRKGTAIKLFVYDGNGFWCCHKRFSAGTLAWWPTRATMAAPLSAAQLQIVLQQGSPVAAALPDPWVSVQSNPTRPSLTDNSKVTNALDDAERMRCAFAKRKDNPRD